jgi:hypothetical protein
VSPTRRTPAANSAMDELQGELAAARLDNARLVAEAKDALAQQTAVSETLQTVSRSHLFRRDDLVHPRVLVPTDRRPRCSQFGAVLRFPDARRRAYAGGETRKSRSMNSWRR